jgi:hypothetical protein
MTKMKLQSNIICVYLQGLLICNSIYSNDFLNLGIQLVKNNSIITIETVSKHYNI